jgi:D-methionine transport system substrate-binding protein
MITQIYQQGEYCVINGNFALQAGIPTPKRVALEKTSGSATDNPYNNLIAVKKGNESTPKTLALVKSLQNSVIYD